MRRRDFVRFLAIVVAAPVEARAQEPGRVYRLGILDASRREDPQFVALFDELRRAGFVEGENLHIEGYFWARDEEAPGDAAAIVAAGADAILVTARLGRPVQQATGTIPILAVGNDLVRQGFVSTLSHPGGNTTGISILGTELDGKRQELLMGLVPGAHHIAALADPPSARRSGCKLCKRSRERAASSSRFTAPRNPRRSSRQSLPPKLRARKPSMCWRRHYS
jgi:putative tryptophan/tyrosine transport system substrate-binding protein